MLELVVNRFVQYKKGLISFRKMVWLIVKDLFLLFKFVGLLVLPIAFSIVAVLGFFILVLKLLIAVLGYKITATVVYLFGFGLLSIATVQAFVELIKENNKRNVK